jgi:hypothetical protein
LEGDQVVFLEAEQGATALVLDLEEAEDHRLARVATSDLTAGMYVLLRAAGGGDYIIPVADAQLGAQAEQLRAMQREWKARLREVVRRSSLFEVSVRLLDLRSRRADETNLRRWIWERSIRPNDRADFDAIMALIGLEAHSEQYWRAMERIDRAHLKAGQVIRRELLTQVRQADLSRLEASGSMEFEIPGVVAGSLVACRVLMVSDNIVNVPSWQLGRPIATGAA